MAERPRCWNCGHPFRPEARYCGACGVRLTTTRRLQRDPTGLLAGETLGSMGRYRVEKRIGSGGFGEAYLTTDTWLNRPCVIKRLRTDVRREPEDQRRLEENFVREARLLVSLNTPGHPNIPEIYDLLLDEFCLVMKYIQGRSLQAILDRRSSGLPEHEALRYAREVCAALVYLHSRPEPIVHRDVKPANVLIDSEDRVWLVDFGLSKATPTVVTGALEESSGSGTVGYTPVEQWAGQSEPRSDVYALGATLQTMLTNQAPEVGPTTLYVDHLNEPTPVPGSLRSNVMQLLGRCLAPEVHERPTASELLTEIDALLAEPTIPPPPPLRRPPLPDTFIHREEVHAAVLARLEQEGVCIIAGPAGTGKSSLAAAVTSGWAAGGTVWYACHEGESAEGLIWSLAGFLHSQGRPELWRWLHSAAQPGVAPPPLETLARTLVGQLRGRPCLLCLDDLHLAAHEPAMSDMLAQLISEARAGTLTLLATAQQAPAQFTPAMQLHLEGLSAAEGHELLAGRGISLETELLDQLLALTAGNPQFLSLAAAALQQGADPATLLRELPRDERVAEYLVATVDRRLSNDQREVMRAVSAMLGEPASQDAIEALLGRAELWSDLQALRSQRLLNPQASQGTLRYTQHALVQGFYYEQIGRRGRRLLHARAADYYEHDEPAPLRAARHYLLANDQRQAARMALRNIWTSINAGEARPLAALLGQIESEQLLPTQVVELALARGEIAALLGAADAAKEQYETAMARAEMLGSPQERAMMLARSYRGLGALLEYSDAGAALQWLQRGLEVLEAVASVGATGERSLLQHRIGSALLALGEYDAALAALETALGQLPATAHQARAGLLVNIGIAHCSQGRMDEGRDGFERAIAAYTLAEDVWGLTAARHNLAQVIEIAGEWERAAVEYGEVLALAQRLGDMRRQVRVGLSLGILQTNKGEYAAAERSLAACVELARASDDREGTLAAQSSLADLALRRGERQKVGELLDSAEALASSIAEDHPQLAEILRSRAQLLLLEGHVGAAQSVAERALAIAQGLDDPREIGMSQRVQGLVALANGQQQEGIALLAASTSLLDEADPYEAARSRLAEGRALRAAGALSEAERLLSAARSTFASLGARRDVEVVEGLV